MQVVLLIHNFNIKLSNSKFLSQDLKLLYYNLRGFDTKSLLSLVSEYLSFVTISGCIRPQIPISYYFDIILLGGKE